MELLSFIKGMKIEDCRPDELVFRTSKAPSAFGIMLVITGVGLGIRAISCGHYFCPLGLVYCGFFLLGIFAVSSGVLIATYKKTVRIDRNTSRIEYEESTFFGKRSAVFHFSEVLHMEVCPIAECLISKQACMWNIKIYFKRHQGFAVERLFSSLRYEHAEEASHLLSQMLKCSILENHHRELESSLSTQAGI
jgi:hypothetical protein